MVKISKKFLEKMEKIGKNNPFLEKMPFFHFCCMAPYIQLTLLNNPISYVNFN